MCCTCLWLVLKDGLLYGSLAFHLHTTATCLLTVRMCNHRQTILILSCQHLLLFSQVDCCPDCIDIVLLDMLTLVL